MQSARLIFKSQTSLFYCSKSGTTIFVSSAISPLATVNLSFYQRYMFLLIKSKAFFFSFSSLSTVDPLFFSLSTMHLVLGGKSLISCSKIKQFPYKNSTSLFKTQYEFLYSTSPRFEYLLTISTFQNNNINLDDFFFHRYSDDLKILLVENK